MDPSPNLVHHSRHLQQHRTRTLSTFDAEIVLTAIREVCDYRPWDLYAAHVRANHVHLVAEVDVEPGRAIGVYKAYASRALNRCGRVNVRWSRGGNAHLLASEKAIREAVRYVAEKQGDPMAVFVGGRMCEDAARLLKVFESPT